MENNIRVMDIKPTPHNASDRL